MLTRRPKPIPESNDGDEFARFIRDRKSDLRRIASAAGRDCELEDVEQSAWLLAQEIAVKRGIKPAFLDLSYQDLLISWLYQRLARYTEPHIRRATRLDHYPSESDDETTHPLLRRLVSDNGRDPLAELEDQETARLQLQREDDYSLASAYVHLLNRFDNRMRTLANYLLICESTARRHCINAASLARHQYSVAINHRWKDGFQLRPWRRFRLERIPFQLELPFLTMMTLPWDSEQ